MEQILPWVLIVAPWFLLLPLDSIRVRRFMSVAFLIVVITTITHQLAEIYNWWTVTSDFPFLTNVSTFAYGLLPVVTILMFYFTYPNIWLFFGVNIVFDAFQAFVISPFVFERFGLYRMEEMSNFGLFILIIILVPVIYFYQRWYDKKLNSDHFS
ncbi:hypothetical protein J2S74_000078 [Evansella vedderi]|uniref:Lycopene cyclase domain-containing protein n=1 Tax=Evansella vedderi TaxID=38282 RepID=A0ABT9ZN98_9BACI|nr:hypothetical protein [Evansella vedderi]MDQ0252706.1 hypothetical protein [Evansella vedderi]